MKRINLLNVILLLFFISSTVCSQGVKIFTYLENRIVRTLDPYLNRYNEVNERLSFLMFAKLFRVNEEARYIPDVAESWTAESPTSFIIKLREDILWNDDNTSPMRARDVYATYRWLDTTRECPAYPKLPEQLSHLNMEIVDSLRLRVTLRGIDEYTAKERLSFPIIPDGVRSDRRKIREFTNRLFGCGPFYFREHGTSNNESLLRNDNYYRWQNDNQNKIDLVTMIPIPDDPARVNEFMAGHAAMLVEIPFKEISMIDNMGLALIRPYQTLSYEYLGVNYRKPALQDIRVREAISKAINRDRVISSVFFGQAKPISGPFPEGSPYFDPNVLPDPYDADVAAQLIESARKDKAIEKLELLYIQEDGYIGEEKKRACIMIMKFLQDIGLEVEMVGVSSGEWDDRLYKTHNFDLALGSVRSKDLLGDITPLFHAREIGEGLNKTNYMGFNVQEINKELDVFSNLTDVETKKIKGRILHGRFAEQRPHIFLWSLKMNSAFNRQKIGIVDLNAYSFFDRIFDWEVTK
ncbi:MAG: ABC transporter substrate-binding protein [Ignavibacteriae bacterium]|nr:ABC transporter substrate-binding protein [Ignavibacteriota bacterium]